MSLNFTKIVLVGHIKFKSHKDINDTHHVNEWVAEENMWKKMMGKYENNCRGTPNLDVGSRMKNKQNNWRKRQWGRREIRKMWHHESQERKFQEVISGVKGYCGEKWAQNYATSLNHADHRDPFVRVCAGVIFKS